MIHARGHTRSGATSSRNSTLALTRSTRPSGHSVNSSETGTVDRSREDAQWRHRQLGLDRQHLAIERVEHEREQRTRAARPIRDTDDGHEHDLREEDPEHRAARRADALHGGDDLAPLVDEGRDRVGDADAADEQRRQADERQELAQPVERARTWGKDRAGRRS